MLLPEIAAARGGFYGGWGARSGGWGWRGPACGAAAVGSGIVIGLAAGSSGYAGYPLDDSYDYPYRYGEYAVYGPWAYRAYYGTAYPRDGCRPFMARACAWLSSAIEGFGANVVRGGYHAKRKRRIVGSTSIFCDAGRSALSHRQSHMMAQGKPSASTQNHIIAPAMASKRVSSDTERYGFAWSPVGQIRTGFSRQTGFVK